MDTEHMLIQFGLTHQEARIYIHLHSCGKATGYELAKETGISRSNAYAGLSSLVEKGGAWLIDGKPACYQAVPVREFCENIIRGLEATGKLLEQQLPASAEPEEGYFTIKGEKNIRDKIETMILHTQTHIYLSMRMHTLASYLPMLSEAAASGKKVVVISDGVVEDEKIIVHRNPKQPDAIRVISDTVAALTGSLDEAPGCSCLYSRKKNLVSLLRDSMRNEIQLIQITGGNKI